MLPKTKPLTSKSLFSKPLLLCSCSVCLTCS